MVNLIIGRVIVRSPSLTQTVPDGLLSCVPVEELVLAVVMDLVAELIVEVVTDLEVALVIPPVITLVVNKLLAVSVVLHVLRIARYRLINTIVLLQMPLKLLLLLPSCKSSWEKSRR